MAKEEKISQCEHLLLCFSLHLCLYIFMCSHPSLSFFFLAPSTSLPLRSFGSSLPIGGMDLLQKKYPFICDNGTIRQAYSEHLKRKKLLPCVIVPDLLYLGGIEEATNPDVFENLGIRNVVGVSRSFFRSCFLFSLSFFLAFLLSFSLSFSPIPFPLRSLFFLSLSIPATPFTRFCHPSCIYVAPSSLSFSMISPSHFSPPLIIPLDLSLSLSPSLSG